MSRSHREQHTRALVDRHFSRRSFIAALSVSTGGLALGLFPCNAWAGEKGALKPNVFVQIDPSGEVTFVCHRSEMGQGIRSSLAGLFADELGANPSKVKLVQADGDAMYGDQNTDGSSSIRGQYEKLRRTAGTARVMLIAAAAKRWNSSPDQCEARDHDVFNRKTRAKLGFGELVLAAAQLPVPKESDVPLRPLTDLRKSLPLLDSPAFVTGTALFGADIRVPGMLIAVIARPPVVGGRVTRYDPSRALAIAGVRQVIPLPEASRPYAFKVWGGIAVLADNTWAAIQGRAALEIVWDPGENGGYDSIAYKETLRQSINKEGTPARALGDVDAALKSAARTVDAEYHVPHLAHVPMEPPVALARFNSGKAEIWASTQNPQAARKEAAGVLGLSQADVTVHVTFLGGGFGRKSKADFVAEAAFLAKEAKAPVRVQWTREDDLRHDYYNAVNSQKLTAGLDAKNKVVAWRHRTAFPPIASTFVPPIASMLVSSSKPAGRDLQQGVLDLALSVPNVRAEACEAAPYVRIGWLRSVYNIFHAFAEGSFIDELAHARRVDPREMWLEILGPARHVSLRELGISSLPNYDEPIEEHPVDAGRLRHVIERVTVMSDWKNRKRNGRTLGLAAHRSFLSYVATVVSVAKDAYGKLRVDDAWTVIDAGQVVNADRVRSQMEGAVIFGISHALYGGATMKNGVTQQTNFNTYKLARIAEVPRKIQVEIVESAAKAGGVGEPGVPPVAPAIANALFALAGTRVRELPLLGRT
ncbi:MAG: molybdopterin cofactor-binding domain-containing protein [Myxococcaceae bacterium]